MILSFYLVLADGVIVPNSWTWKAITVMLLAATILLFRSIANHGKEVKKSTVPPPPPNSPPPPAATATSKIKAEAMKKIGKWKWPVIVGLIALVLVLVWSHGAASNSGSSGTRKVVSVKLEPALTPLEAVAFAESRGKHTDENGILTTGSSGELGSHQIMPLHFEKGGLCENLSPNKLPEYKVCVNRLYELEGLKPWFSSMDKPDETGWANMLPRNKPYLLAKVFANKDWPRNRIPIPQTGMDVLWKSEKGIENLRVLVNGKWELGGNDDLMNWFEENGVPLEKRESIVNLKFKALHTPTKVTVVMRPRS